MTPLSLAPPRVVEPEGRSTPWNLPATLTALRAARGKWRDAHHRHLEVGIDGFPSRQRIDRAITDLCSALLPQRLGEAHGEEDEEGYVAHVLDWGLETLLGEVRLSTRAPASARASSSITAPAS